MPSWAGSANSIQYSKLTHINYAFVLPNSNGSLQGLDNPSKLQSMVSLGHAAGVKVSIAVGGWNDGNDSGFEALAGNATARTAFVNNIVNLVNQYNLDGVDIDWEYPDPGTSGNNYTALMSQLSTAMHSRGKLLTAAVVSEGGTANGVQPAVVRLRRLAQHHGVRRRQPARQLRLVHRSRQLLEGPRPAGAQGGPRRAVLQPARVLHLLELVAMDPANANRDCTTVNGAQQCYNGIPTIKRKTRGPWPTPAAS